MNHLQHNIDMGIKEYDPQSMIDDINRSNNDMKFTTAGDYMDDVQRHLAKPTGGETWQTKATAKGAVPKYYTPKELQQMSEDKGYEYRYVTQQIYPQDMAKYIVEQGDTLSDDHVIALLKSIDFEFTRRFGTDPYSRLIKMNMEDAG